MTFFDPKRAAVLVPIMFLSPVVIVVFTTSHYRRCLATPNVIREAVPEFSQRTVKSNSL